ncbi:PaaI family thioesterase [Nocardia nova]|uniref:PaaI family thioesterase n=1 Tax=Nocardia nova TaxID=37330 RepID=UPI0031832124
MPPWTVSPFAMLWVFVKVLAVSWNCPLPAFAANGIGDVHGGILLCGAEFAAMSALEADGSLRTTSIDMVFVRPGNANDTTTFRAEVVHRGRSLAVVRVVAVNASGKTCAEATVTVQRGS